MALTLQKLAVNAFEPRVLGFKGRIDHLVDSLIEAGIDLVKAKAMPKIAEKFYIAPALPQGRDGLLRDLQVIVSIRSLQLFVLEKSRRR